MSLCSKLLTGRSSECNVWFEVAWRNGDRYSVLTRSLAKRFLNTPSKPEEFFNESQASSMTECYVNVGEEEAADTGAFKNVRVKRMDVTFRTGSFDATQTTKGHSNRAESDDVNHLSTHEIWAIEEHNARMLVIRCVCCLCPWHIAIPGEAKDVPEKVPRLSDHTKLAIPLLNSP